jgi:predicted AlkP superfamily pyrophosphatase or phosphodiesterase
VSDYNHLGKVFPHRIDGGLTGPGKAFYRAFATTPFANDFVFDTARELISRERLGQDEIPDLLAISLSTNDYIGHVFGPDSEEVLDACVRTDRALSDFLNALDRLIPGGLARVTIVLSADHGVAPNAALLKEAGIPAGGYDDEAIGKAAEAALDRVFGEGDWTEAYTGGGLYLKHETAEARKVDLARAEEVAAEAMASQPGVYAAYTRAQILSGAMPHTEIAASVSRSFHPKISGDVVIVADPQWTYAEALSGATHGSPYVYDTKVPVLFAGAGIRKGRFAERASTLDVAPTLSELLGILSPSGCEGRVLGNALTSLSPADGRPAAAVH